MPKSEIPVDVLIEQLHGADWTARCEAARLLGQSRDPRAVEALLPDVNDPDWRVRRNAAQALGALRDPRATGPLLGLLKDRTLTVRQRAIVALGRIKDPQALPALLEILVQEKRESYDASKAIRKFGKKALPEIVQAYEANSHQELLLLLVDLKYAGIFDLLLKSLESDKPSARHMAIRELGNLADKRAIPHLMNRLHDSDLSIQTDIVDALGRLKATEAIPALLGLLKGNDLYGPRSVLYRTVTNAFQKLGGVVEEIQNAFPGNYPSMFNMGGMPVSLPEMMGLLGNTQSNLLSDAISRLQTGFAPPENLSGPVGAVVQKSVEDMSWKFGVMFADARDVKQERVTRLIELLCADSGLTRAAAALSLPWYGEERSLEPLKQLLHDPQEIVQTAARWAARTLETMISYRKQSGT